MNRRIFARTRSLTSLLAVFLLASCGYVETTVFPTYSLTFRHYTTTLDSSVVLTGTPAMNTAFVAAGGTVAKEQTSSNTSVNQQFPEYAEILLIQPSVTYSLGWGCEECLRFRFKANGNINVTLNVVPSTEEFWINGDVFDSFNEIGADEIHIQYIFNDQYWPATAGTVTLLDKTVVATSDRTGTASILVQFNNVTIPINGNNYVLSGTAQVNTTDSDE